MRLGEAAFHSLRSGSGSSASVPEGFLYHGRDAFLLLLLDALHRLQELLQGLVVTGQLEGGQREWVSTGRSSLCTPERDTGCVPEGDGH